MKIRRDQLASFIKDQETIIKFQRLFDIVDTTIPDAIIEISVKTESISTDVSNVFTLINQDNQVNQAALVSTINELKSDIVLISEFLKKEPSDNSQHNFCNRDYIDFNINVVSQIDAPGRCLWNEDDGTLNLGLNNEVVLQIGQEQNYYAKNVSGGIIYNGQPVTFAGTIGASGKLEIDLAEADSAIAAENFMGVATQDIANNGFGYVTSFGLVRGIDTTGTPVGEVWSDGDFLYLSATAGELTITPPTAPDPKILVAVVVYSHSSVGSIFIRPTWGGYLSSLHDVYITSAADNDLITWNDSNQRWENTADPVVDTISINDGSIYSGTQGEGVQVDISTPTYPWHDLLGEIRIRGVAATDPTYIVYTGNIRAYQFSLNDVVWNEYHISHDYAPSTDLYIHVHWSHTSASVTSGSVTWSFEITYAKGHDQQAFPSTKTITVTQSASTTQYQHMIAEVAFTADTEDSTHFDRDDIEIDGLVLVATSLTANSISASTDPFVHYIDIHYQSTGIGSKNKAPNFYVT